MGNPNDPDNGEVCQRCDTYLTTEDGTVFLVNSELLSRHSKFFSTLFLMGEEAGQSTVIRNIKPDIFQIILTYMSTGKILFTTENIMDLLVASDFLMSESLSDECRKFVLQNKKVENLLSFFLTAKRLNDLGMEDQLRRYLVVCFEKVVMHSIDEACCLPYSELKYFLSHKSLNVSSERIIWAVIEAWVSKDPVKRHSFVPGLLRCLSVHEIDDELASYLLSSPIIEKNAFYKDLKDSNYTIGIYGIKFLVQAVILFRNQLPFIYDVRVPPFLNFVARNFRDRPGTELFVSYDDGLDFGRKVGETPQKISRLLAAGPSVYFLRHYGGGSDEICGLYYDLLTNELKRMALPSFAEDYDDGDYCVGEVGGCVYALGRCGTPVERYVPATDEWKKLRYEFQRGVPLGAVSVNGLLYVVRDCPETQVILTYEYDPSKDKWARLPSPDVRRILPKPVVYKDKLFLVGGVPSYEAFDHVYGQYVEDHPHELPVISNWEDSDDDVEEGNPNANDELDSSDDENEDWICPAVEVYDPKSKEWTELPELPFRIFPVFVTVVNDSLYVYKNAKCPVAYWDGSGQWKIAENPSQLFYHKFCAVKDMNARCQIMWRNKEVDPTVWLETDFIGEIS